MKREGLKVAYLSINGQIMSNNDLKLPVCSFELFIDVQIAKYEIKDSDRSLVHHSTTVLNNFSFLAISN